MKNVRDFGAVGDGVADDTAAIQATIQAGGCAYAPEGRYNLTAPLFINDVYGERLIGDGPRNTIFEWMGNATDAAIVLASSYTGALEDFSIHVITPKVLHTGILIYTKTVPRTYVSRTNRFINLTIEGNTNELGTGVRIGGLVGADANNDFHYFESVRVLNYSGIAYSLENSQVYGIQFQNCSFVSGIAGAHGVSTRDHPSGNGIGGNFLWSGGGGAVWGTAFRLGSHNGGATTIQNADFERAARLLETGGASPGDFRNTILDGVSYRSVAPAVDGYVIKFLFGGNLSLRNCRIGLNKAFPLRIQLIGTLPGVYSIQESIFLSSNATIDTLVPYVPSVRVRNSIIQTPTGNVAINNS